MFLDDKLIKICVEADIIDPEDVQETYSKLINTCQDHYKERVRLNMPKKEVKSIIDQTFHSWTSFVRMAMNHDNNQVVILGKLCNKFTFKDVFMKDTKLLTFYKML
jgi:hypothetical protein